jgi:hypothetical protein
MRFLRTILTVTMFVPLAPRAAAAQDHGSVNFVSGLSLNQGSSITNAGLSGVNFGGRVAVSLAPGFQAVGEVGRIGNVLPSLVTSVVAFLPFDVRASATYGEGGVRMFGATRSSVNPYVEATAGMARLNVRVNGIGASADDLVNLGLAFVSRTPALAGIGGGVMLHSGPMSFDVGYRYKKIFAKDLVDAVLGGGQSLRSHQVTFGVGIRF